MATVVESALREIIQADIVYDPSQTYHVRCQFRFQGSFLVLSKDIVRAELSHQIRDFLRSNDDWAKSYVPLDDGHFPVSKRVAEELADQLIERELKIERIALPLVEELLNV